jgi:hydroxyacylglutathione hydrolase
MRVSPHVHALLLNFEIELASGVRIPRFVPAYVIEAERLAVVDTAVKSSAPTIFEYIESLGRKPEEIEYVIHTHGHFDHVGGNGLFAERAKPRFCAHPNDKAIIESLEYQERVRPVGRMREQNTSGNITVTDLLNDGDTLDLGGGVQVDVFHTPGHSPGSVSLFIPGDGTLFCGDVLPEPGAIPIYEHVGQTLESVRTLRRVSGATVLLSQLSDQVWTGDDVRTHIDDGEAYVRRVDRVIRQTATRLGSGALFEEVCRTVLRELRLPEAASALPIYQTTVLAHLVADPLGE